MNLDNYASIIPLIISVIVTINTFSKLEKSNKLSEDYFEKAISLYVKEYKGNPNINPLDFIKQRFNIKDYFIPNYIFYLVDNGQKEKLHKILMVDYRQKYPNKENNIFNGIYNISVIFMYILAFAYIALITIVSILGITIFISLIKDMVIYQTMDSNNIRDMIILILIFIASIIMIFLFKIIIHDDYVIKNKQIEKVIKRKEKQFEKYNDSYYIK